MTIYTYTVDMVLLHADPARGLCNHDPDDWPPELVLFRADAKEIRLMAVLPGVQESLKEFLHHVAFHGGHTNDEAEKFAAEVQEKAVEKLGAWVADISAHVTAAVVNDDGPVYMPVVITDIECLRVARLKIYFKEETPF